MLASEARPLGKAVPASARNPVPGAIILSDVPTVVLEPWVTPRLYKQFEGGMQKGSICILV